MNTKIQEQSSSNDVLAKQNDVGKAYRNKTDIKGKTKSLKRGKKIKNKLKHFEVLFNNIRGLKPKTNRIEDTIMTLNPNIFCLFETQLSQDETWKCQGYSIITQNRN